MSATATIRVNGAEHELTEPALQAVLQRHGVGQARGVAVAVNGAVVPRGEWSARRLAPGDEVEILRIVGGG